MPHPDATADTAPLGIIGGTPAYRRGLATTFADHAWRVEYIDDPATWLQAPGPRMLMIHLEQPEHGHPLLGLDRPAHTSILVLAHDPVAEDHVTLTRAGADVIAPAEAEPDHLAAILTAFLDGHAILPLTTLYRLTAMARSHRDHPALADAEIKWLTLLAQGRTVNDLADLEHRSSRSMHRALTGLYQRIGVANRDQAIAWAARHDILDPT